MLIKENLKNSTTSIEYKYYNYNHSESYVGLEIYRRNIFKKLEKEFYNLFNTKESLINLFHYGYANNNNNLDPVICINIKKKFYDSLLNLNIPVSKIDKFNLLTKKYIKLIDDYKQVKEDYVKIKDLNNNLFKLVANNDETLLIHKNTYFHMINRLKIFNDELDNESQETIQKIFVVLFRNKYIDNLTGMSAALPHKYLEYMRKNNFIDIELFGSAYNAYYKYYFGLFYDIEKDFGCLGNFFNCKLNYGFFYMNPPFVNWLMNKAFKHIHNLLEDLTNKISVTVLVPVWKKSDRIELNKNCKTKLKIDDYNEIFNVELLRKSKFMVYNKIWCKENFKYVNYINNKKINYAPSNIFVVSNLEKPNDMKVFKHKIF